VSDALRIGPLEAAVLRHLWKSGQATVKAVHRALGVRRGISLHTVQSAMDRLHRKDLLHREKVSHAYVYAPAVSRGELGTRIIEQAVSQLAGEPSTILSALVDYAAREGDDRLAELEALVARRRSEGPEGEGEA
jgi:predicted transcriptional regulator